MNKLASAILLTLSVTAQAAPQLSGTPHELSQYLLEQKRIISIQTEATERVEADRAIASILVKTRASQLTQALEQNEALRRTLRQQLQQAGIPDNAIQGSRFSSTPNPGWFGDKPGSYDVNNELRIRISDEQQLQAIARLVDEQKALYFGGMEFEDSAAAQHELRALEMALTKVEQQRALYESQLGMTLRPVRISNQRVFVQAPQARRLMTNKAAAEAMSAAVELPDPGSDFGAISYRAHILVEFTADSDGADNGTQ